MTFRAAHSQAARSPYPRHKLGAVISKGGRILSTGFNQSGYSHIIRPATGTVHAEEAAILKLLKARRLHDLVGADIHVSRLTPGGRHALAKPCERCMDLIRSCNLRRVFYTTDEGTECLSF